MKTRNAVLVVMACTLMVVLSFTRYTAAEDSPQRIEITAKRFAFSPAEITVKKGVPAILVIKSEDVTHGLHLPELAIETVIAKGSKVEVPFTPDQAGDFVGHCAVFCGAGHGGMALTIHVIE
jgi:cytochrome c oxidase subunit 2